MHYRNMLSRPEQSNQTGRKRKSLDSNERGNICAPVVPHRQVLARNTNAGKYVNLQPPQFNLTLETRTQFLFDLFLQNAFQQPSTMRKIRKANNCQDKNANCGNHPQAICFTRHLANLESENHYCCLKKTG